MVCCSAHPLATFDMRVHMRMAIASSVQEWIGGCDCKTTLHAVIGYSYGAIPLSNAQSLRRCSWHTVQSLCPKNGIMISLQLASFQGAVEWSVCAVPCRACNCGSLPLGDFADRYHRPGSNPHHPEASPGCLHVDAASLI